MKVFFCSLHAIIPRVKMPTYRYRCSLFVPVLKNGKPLRFDPYTIIHIFRLTVMR